MDMPEATLKCDCGAGKYWREHKYFVAFSNVALEDVAAIAD